jgi:hypothetical protein
MTTMKRMLMAGLALAALALGACDKNRGMEVRTYTLHRMTSDDAMTLLTPYIREGGYISGKGRLITVRERPAQLDSVAAILKRYDGAPQAVTLRFQVIEAGDFAGGDSAIARVEAPLRELFRYRGYRLLGEVTVRALEGTPFRQEQEGLGVSGTVREVTPAGPDAQVTVDVGVTSPSGSVSTSVSGAPGRTLVIGTQKRTGGGAIIAAVTPEVAPSTGAGAARP